MRLGGHPGKERRFAFAGPPALQELAARPLRAMARRPLTAASMCITRTGSTAAAARSARRLIPFLRDRCMPRQARVFEWCAGPAFIGFSMLGHGLCETLCLADINPMAVTACRRTIASNGLGGSVTVYHSDDLSAIPVEEQWDLVVSNPPFFDKGRFICGHTTRAAPSIVSSLPQSAGFCARVGS